MEACVREGLESYVTDSGYLEIVTPSLSKLPYWTAGLPVMDKKVIDRSPDGDLEDDFK